MPISGTKLTFSYLKLSADDVWGVFVGMFMTGQGFYTDNWMWGEKGRSGEQEEWGEERRTRDNGKWGEGERRNSGAIEELVRGQWEERGERRVRSLEEKR